MCQEQKYSILAYYIFTPLVNPYEEVTRHKQFFERRDAASRIYISHQGINGQMSAATQDANAYMEWMLSRPEFASIKFKVHPYHENVFPRLTIKYRKNLVAYDREVDAHQGGEHVSPEQWANMLEKEHNKVLLDVRNDYEWKIGHFEGAELPPCETFRDFEKYAQQLKESVDPKETPVMMYCTGGIRCELYSTILKEQGFDKVYQLDGGVINYGLKHSSKHWLGKLFVFDDRMAIPINDEKTPSIGTCHQCNTPSESYYNCANMDCNLLFISCPQCLKELAGCCKASCSQAERVRPYHHQNPHKPFRRWYNYFAETDPESNPKESSAPLDTQDNDKSYI